MSFLSKTAFKCHTKYQIWSTLSTWEVRWCAVRRDTSYCLSILLSHMGTQKQTEMLLKLYPSLLRPTSYHFCQKHLSNFMQNMWFGAPTQQGKWDAVLLEMTSIATWVFQNLPYIQKDNWKCFWQHIRAPYGSHYVISVNNNPHVSSKISDFWHAFSKGSDALWCKER